MQRNYKQKFSQILFVTRGKRIQVSWSTNIMDRNYNDHPRHTENLETYDSGDVLKDSQSQAEEEYVGVIAYTHNESDHASKNWPEDSKGGCHYDGNNFVSKIQKERVLDKLLIS